MNAREFVTNIINRGRNQIMQRVKSLPKLLSVGLISMLGLLPLTSIPNRGMTVYAQHIQQQGRIPTTDPWYQSLEVAHSKVQAALSPGAFGHGVPELHNLTTNDILMAFGISILGSIVVFMAVRALLEYMNKEKMGRVSLLNKMI
jgi:hypothetical protein